MKQCKICKQFKMRSEFHSSGYYTTKAGQRLLSIKPECKKCAGVFWKASFEEKLNSIVSEWKCTRCGYDKCKAALEFHHTESDEKDFSISSRRTVKLEKLKQEIDKCVLLCANCHRETHEDLKISTIGV